MADKLIKLTEWGRLFHTLITLHAKKSDPNPATSLYFTANPDDARNGVWTPLRCWLLACNDGWPQWLTGPTACNHTTMCTRSHSRSAQTFILLLYCPVFSQLYSLPPRSLCFTGRLSFCLSFFCVCLLATSFKMIGSSWKFYQRWSERCISGQGRTG